MNCGKALAVRAGLLAALSTVALFSDDELSTPMTEMRKMLSLIMRGERDVVFDAVSGSQHHRRLPTMAA